MLKFLLISLFLTGSTLILAQEQDEVCPPGEEFWPHENCSKYWICNNGLPIELDCPGGLFWNQNITACDFPNNVPECRGGTRPPIDPTTTMAPPPTTTTQPPTTTTQPPPTTTTRPTTQPPTTTRPTTQPPTTTRPTTQPPTTTRPTTQPPPTTTPPPPPTTTAEPLPGTCPGEGIVKIPHDVLCNAYYLCINGNRTEQTCPNGLLFDPQLGECNVASEVDCGDLVTPPPATTTTQAPPTSTQAPPSTTTATQAPPTTTTPPPSTNCPPTGSAYVPYPGNCTLYRACENGNVVGIYRCAPGTLFDTVERVCRPEGVAICTVQPIALIANDIQVRMENDEVEENRFMHRQKNEGQDLTNEEIMELGKMWAPFRLD